MCRKNEIEGIDYGKALAQFGSEETLAGILKTFAAKVPSMLEALKNPDAESLPSYLIHVHGIKGSLYGIFAKEAGDAAAELEKHSKAGDLEAVRETTPAFIVLCEKLLAGMTDWLKANTVDAGTEQKESRPAPDRDLLKKIGSAAGSFKTTELEKLVGELNAFQYETGGDVVEWLVEQSENLEYGAITERLSSML
jgi:HPt (histidine-containing phosphotransfer) domain-containing protein